MKPTRHPQKAFNLSSDLLTRPLSQIDQIQMLDSGRLINVSSWVQREMAFTDEYDRLRVHAAITVTLFNTLTKIPTFIQSFQTVRGRGHNLLWLAAWAIRKARLLNHDFAVFPLVLPTAIDADDLKVVRVEIVIEDDGRPHLTMGFAEEFPLE